MVTWQFCATFCSIVVNLQCLVIHMVCVLIVLEVLMTFVQSIYCRILYGLYLPTVILTTTWYSLTHSLFLSRLKTFFLCKSFPLQPFLSST